jgi:hypothetical protein
LLADDALGAGARAQAKRGRQKKIMNKHSDRMR